MTQPWTESTTSTEPPCSAAAQRAIANPRPVPPEGVSGGRPATPESTESRETPDPPESVDLPETAESPVTAASPAGRIRGSGPVTAPCRKRSKTSDRSSAGMPGPESDTSMTRSPWSAARVAATTTWLPIGLCRAALHGADDGLGTGHVAHQGAHRMLAGGELLRRGLEGLAFAAGDDHLGTALDEAPGQRVTDAAAAAGDEHDLASHGEEGVIGHGRRA